MAAVVVLAVVGLVVVVLCHQGRVSANLEFLPLGSQPLPSRPAPRSIQARLLPAKRSKRITHIVSQSAQAGCYLGARECVVDCVPELLKEVGQEATIHILAPQVRVPVCVGGVGGGSEFKVRGLG